MPNLRVTVYKRITKAPSGKPWADPYTVIIHSANGEFADVYTMSERPLQPNGVNMYCCSLDEMSKGSALGSEIAVRLRDLPLEVAKAVLLRLEDYMHEEDDNGVA